MSVSEEVKNHVELMSIDDSNASKKSDNRRNLIVRGLLWHYGNTKCTISKEQFENEKYLFAKVKFNPLILMPAAVVIQFCCGSLYAWSVFNAPVDEAISGNALAGRAPVTFYIAVGMLGFSGAIMGPWLERNGPKKALILSSSLFLLSNLMSAVAIYLKSMLLLYIGYGVIGGFSIGLSYISPVSPLQKWFPHKRGLAAGLAVGGFGAGSTVIGKVILPLINSVGLALTFVVLGLSYFIAMMCAALVFRIPPSDFSVSSKDDDTEKSMIPKPTKAEIKLTLKESILSRDYGLIYIMLLGTVIFGLVVISRLANMITQLYSKTPDQAATIVSINGALNVFGRLFFSSISDKIGRKTCFLIMLITQAIVIAVFPYYTQHKIYWLFLVCMFALSMCYGGAFGVIPAILAENFGANNIAVCFGVILTAWSLAGVGGGFIFTTIFNSQIASGNSTASDAYPYIINSYWILAVVIVGLMSAICVKTTMKDRLLPPVEGELCRFRIFTKIFRFKRGPTLPEVEVLTLQQYDQEWENYLALRHVSSQNGECKK